MKIIIEGPDCCGKSTLCNNLQERVLPSYYGYVHNESDKDLDENALIYKYQQQLVGQESTIIDRSWPSEMIYGKLFRNGYSRVSEDCDQRFAHGLDLRNDLMIFCIVPIEVVEATYRSRQDEEMVQDWEVMQKIYAAYKGYIKTWELKGRPCIVFNWHKGDVISVNGSSHPYQDKMVAQLMKLCLNL